MHSNRSHFVHMMRPENTMTDGSVVTAPLKLQPEGAIQICFYYYYYYETVECRLSAG